MNVNRRWFLSNAALYAVRPAMAATGIEIHHFQTADVDIEMSIQFHDRYTSRGFWFGDSTSGRRYCLSGSGEEDRDCVSGFHGSLAIACYRVEPRRGGRGVPALREYVRTIDRDRRLHDRPPFERTILLNKGVGSDLQAFGYDPMHDHEPALARHGPWYLHRQDLFLEPQPSPVLILYWKHALTAIRVLDIIPGDQTWVVKR